MIRKYRESEKLCKDEELKKRDSREPGAGILGSC